MRRALVVLVLATLPSIAQAQTGVGVGVGVSSSTSTSGAVAIGGGNGQGGNASSGATGGNANNGLTINTGPAANTRNDSTLDQTVTTRGGTSSVQRQTGGLRNVPSTFAPGLAAAGLESCLGSVSGGGSGMGFGLSFGTTIVDAGCDARLDARQLWGMGLKRASLARLCLKPEIRQSLPECAEYLPQAQPVASYGGPGPVATAPGPARLEPVERPARGQTVMVRVRATGQERACADFDGRRCLRWASR